MKKKIFSIALLGVLSTLSAGVISQNGIAIDSETGLDWQDEPYTQEDILAGKWSLPLNKNKVGNWEYAKAYCENLTLGKYSDWRLPNIYELSTLNSVMGIDEHHISGIKNHLSGEIFLSSTLSSDGYISVVNFNTGKIGVMAVNGKKNSSFIRCVRGPQLTKHFGKQR